MSAQSTIANLRKSLADAQAARMTDEQIIAILADVARSSPEGMENLLAAYHEVVKANRSDLSAAFETALFKPQTNPALVAGGEPLGKAVADSLGDASEPETEEARKNANLGNNLEDAFAQALRPTLIQARDHGSES